MATNKPEAATEKNHQDRDEDIRVAEAKVERGPRHWARFEKHLTRYLYHAIMEP